MKRLTTALLVIALLGALAGCSFGAKSSEAAQTIEITTASMAFGTKELTLQKGKTYKLVIKNNDTVEHDFSIDEIPVKIAEEGHKGGHGAGQKTPDLHVHAEAGKTESVVFTPTESGTYTFYCTVAGHKEAGMVGKLIVQ
ncbi:cupredoxin domain-containing protein [Symbiobacterium terraclitae]|uniref:cupredoxin domain-containing protein n=1 Tax=Symbiobacterium terraclitae TaxID=557451 RepID=UPI0035B55371